MALLDTGYRGLFEDVEPTLPIPGNIESMSPQQKAQVYNQLLSQGFTNSEIRTAIEQQIGPQSNANWGALQDIASGIRATGGTGGGALQTAFGDAASWQFGQGATYQDNMITSQDAYFQRGGDVVVSDELFWNPNSPTGDALKAKVQQAKAQGQRAGVVITPYAVFQGKASNEQLINEIKNSGVDFVALDPYLGFGVPKDDLLNWTKDFIPQLNDLGLGVKLVTQDFARAGMEQETRRYNQELMSLPGVSEFVSFGLEDAPDLQGSPDWVSLSAPTEQAAQATPREPERKTAQEAPPSGAAEVAAPGGLLGSQSVISQPIIDRLAAMPRNEFETVGFQEGGKDYSMDPNGLISVRAVGARPNDQVQVFDQSGNLLATHAVEQRSDFVQAINQAARVGIPAVIGAAILGPAGTGLLNAPAAAAVGSGGSTLLQGGSVEDALKAAALAGLGAYGTQQVTGLLNNAAYDLSFAAADAAQLANQGLNAGAIAQNLATYVDPATAISLANTAATQAFALADATQLTQQGLNQAQVAQVLQSSGISANTAANIAQAAADGVTTLSASDIIPEVRFQRQTNLNQGLLSPADAERVMVTGQAFDIPGIQQLAQGVGAGVSAATVPTAPQVVTQSQTGQQVQQTQIEAQRIDPDAASSILSSVLGQPISVAGSTQQVTVTGETPRQISPDTAAAVLSSLVGQQVQVTGQTVTSQQAAETLPAAASTLLQSVPVTGQTLQTTRPQEVAPAATAGLLAPTQTVPVTAQNIQTTAADVAPAAIAGLLTPPVQTVPVTGQNLPATQDVAGPTGAMLGTAIAPTQTVPVEDRTIRRETTAPVFTTTPGQAVTVEGRTIPTADVSIPTGAAGAALGVSAPAQPTTITARDAALAGLLLAGAGSLGGGGGGQPGGTVSGPISGVIPTYPGRGGYQMPGLFQIAPTNVYNPFATVAPFGAGRFGAVNQPITLPYGLLAGPIGVTAGINTPTRGLI